MCPKEDIHLRRECMMRYIRIGALDHEVLQKLDILPINYPLAPTISHSFPSKVSN